MRALDAAALIVRSLVVGAHEKQVQPHGVGAVFRHHVVRANDVAAALGHLAAVADDDAVGAKLAERFVEIQHVHVGQRHGEKARVHEMQHGVFVAADVAIHRQPLAGEFSV